MNIDPSDKKEQARQRRMRRQQQARRNDVRNKVGCPRCKAKIGEYCLTVSNRPRISLHTERHHLAHAKKLPSEKRPLLGVDVEAFIKQHGVKICPQQQAKGYGGIRPSVSRRPRVEDTLITAEQESRSRRNRSR
jgi:hypothetical protein